MRVSAEKAKIAVIGLGYVGLPLAVEFAKKGITVFGIDVDKGRITRLKKGISYVADVPQPTLKKVLSSFKFIPSSDFSLLKKAGAVIICVPTPLKRKYHPDISFIKEAVKKVRKFLRPGQLVILESTTYPGTTDEVILPILEESGLICGKDFYLAFSPERIDPGNKIFPVNKIPKIIGGTSKEATELAAHLYKNIIDKVVPVSSARAAEAVKLLENTFRIVNIGLIDEMAMMAHKMKLDIWEIIDAAKTKPFGFMPFYPGPGVGGHCIPKDPLYLYWKAKQHGFKSRYIKLSSDIINYMPKYVVARVTGLLNAKKPVLVVGVTYKKDIKDLRKSPALDLIDCFHKKGFSVSYYDPLIPYLKLTNLDLKSIEPSVKNLKKFGCIVIATDHSCVDYAFIRKNAKMIFDTRNVYAEIKDAKIHKL